MTVIDSLLNWKLKFVVAIGVLSPQDPHGYATDLVQTKTSQ